MFHCLKGELISWVISNWFVWKIYPLTILIHLFNSTMYLPFVLIHSYLLYSLGYKWIMFYLHLSSDYPNPDHWRHFLGGLCVYQTCHPWGIFSYSSNCSIGDTRTQDTYKRKIFNWGLAYSFRGLVQNHHGGKFGNRQTNMGLDSWELVSDLPDGSKERTRLGLAWTFGTSKYTPSISSPTRPHLLILLS